MVLTMKNAYLCGKFYNICTYYAKKEKGIFV